MFNRLKILAQILALVLLPAFVLRPVVVTVHNSDLHSAGQPDSKSLSASFQLSQLSAVPSFQRSFRNIEREDRHVALLAPRISGAKTSSLLVSRLSLVFASAVPSPKSSLILRI